MFPASEDAAVRVEVPAVKAADVVDRESFNVLRLPQAILAQRRRVVAAAEFEHHRPFG
jgi:hypothetical protein